MATQYDSVYQEIRAVVNYYLGEGFPVVLIPGNHDSEEGATYFTDHSGYSSYYGLVPTANYDVFMFGIPANAWESNSMEQINALDAYLCSREDPNKPVFIIAHCPIDDVDHNTTPSDLIKGVLEKYNQPIIFVWGHVHDELREPGSDFSNLLKTYPAGYTTVKSGSICYRTNEYGEFSQGLELTLDNDTGTITYQMRRITIKESGSSIVASKTMSLPKIEYAPSQLKNIIVAGRLNSVFDPDVHNYTMALDEYTSKTTIRPIMADSSSKLYINGKKASKKTFTLKPGSKTKVKIRVKPKEGNSEYYYVTISRAKSTNANLNKLTVSKSALRPGFNKNTTEYTLQLTKKQSSVRITPKLADKYAKYTIKVNGKTTTNRTISLKPGQTKTVVITVKAQAGNTKTYKLVIKRAISHNADLAKLKVSKGKLQPVFSPATADYSLALTSSQSSVKLTLKTADSAAKYKIAVDGKILSGTTISLKKGETKTVVVTVTAQAGEKKIYTVVMTRAG